MEAQGDGALFCTGENVLTLRDGCTIPRIQLRPPLNCTLYWLMAHTLQLNKAATKEKKTDNG